MITECQLNNQLDHQNGKYVQLLLIHGINRISEETRTGNRKTLILDIKTFLVGSDLGHRQAGKMLKEGRMNCYIVIFGCLYVNKNIYILNLHVGV